MTPETEITSNEKAETVESHNSELTGMIGLPPAPVVLDPTKTVHQVPITGIPETGINIRVPAHVGANIELVHPEPEATQTVTPRPSEVEMVELAKAALDASDFLQMASENPFIENQLAKGGLVIDRVSLNKFLEFRAEVIRAFKHLGLDTRKHFTE